MAADDTNLEAELRALLAEGRTIEAIKRYREATGADLATAKEAVEALEPTNPLAAGEAIDPDLEAEIIGLLQGLKKIEAIKLYRERTGMGLKEAKDAVEAMAAAHGLPGAAGGGCLSVVLFLATPLLAVVAIVCKRLV